MFNPFAGSGSLQAAAFTQQGRMPQAGHVAQQQNALEELASLTTPSHSEAPATSSYFQNNRYISGVELLAQASMKRPDHGNSGLLATKRVRVTDVTPVAAPEIARPPPAHQIASASLEAVGRRALERAVTRPPYYCGICKQPKRGHVCPGRLTAIAQQPTSSSSASTVTVPSSAGGSKVAP